MMLKTLLAVSAAQRVMSVKLASFNTFQIHTNPYGMSLFGPQIQALSASDFDVICLQELFQLDVADAYIGSLAAYGNYVNSFSMLDVLSAADLAKPRTPCLGSAVPSYLNSSCSNDFCRTYYDDYGSVNGYVYCMAQACPDDLEQIMLTECAGCVAAVAGNGMDLETASFLCSSPPHLAGLGLDQYLLNQTDGAAIVSRLPIVNTWSFELPSWLFLQKRVHVAEINIGPDAESIVVGCTHLHPGHDVLNDVDIPQSPLLGNDEVTSNLGLNRYQTEYLLDNIFNDDLLDTLGRSDDADNVMGVFLMGDTNSGAMFDRCAYTASPVDNCAGENPSNPFDLFALGGFTDAASFVGESALCTFCLDASSNDFNPFTFAKVSSGGGVIVDASTDLDHILIQDALAQKIEDAEFERVFMDAVVGGVNPFGLNESVTVSDHYGVTLDVTFKSDVHNAQTADKQQDDGYDVLSGDAVSGSFLLAVLLSSLAFAAVM